MYDERGDEQLGLTLSGTGINLIYGKKLPSANEEESYTSTTLTYDKPVIRGKYGIQKEFILSSCFVWDWNTSCKFV